jgi:putative tryptophan/tyrosine transport system substrate-binding protein
MQDGWRRREVMAMLGGAAVLAAGGARAQQTQTGSIRRVGILMPTAESDRETTDLGAVFRQALQKQGWTGGRNLSIDYRWGNGDQRRIDALAVQLVADNPDVILAGGAPTVAPLKRATTTIPIVFVSASDPVRQGFVKDAAHPGGNITGLTNFEPSMGVKWLDILKELAPGVTRVAVLYNPATAPYTDGFLHAVDAAAPGRGVKIQGAPVHDASEIEPALAALGGKGDAGLLVPSDAFTLTRSQAVADLAARYGLPAVYAFRVFAANGGLVSYGIDLGEEMRMAAIYVDRILSGTAPGDMPVLGPTKFEIVINKKAATALGLTIPPTLLARTDEVIE